MEALASRPVTIHETRRVCPESSQFDAKSAGTGWEQEHELVWIVESLQDGSGAKAVGDVVEAAIGQLARDRSVLVFEYTLMAY